MKRPKTEQEWFPVILALAKAPTLADASAEIGVSSSTVYRWLRDNPGIARRARNLALSQVNHARSQLDWHAHLPYSEVQERTREVRSLLDRYILRKVT